MRSKKIFYNMLSTIVFAFLSMLLGFLKVKLIVTNLGIEVDGLYSFLIGTFTYLHILEGGFGIALTYSLYGPLAADDKNKISEILSGAKRIYQLISLAMLVCGILVAFILPFFVKTTTISNSVMYTAYFIMLANFTISMFLIGPSNLFDADQKTYVKNNILKTGQLVTSIGLVIMLLLFDVSIIEIVTFELIIRIIFVVYTLKKLRDHYPWLNLKAKPDYSNVSKVKAIFVHKLASMLVYQTDLLVVTVFIGLISASIYNKYIYVIVTLQTLIHGLMLATQASFGNVFAKNEDTTKKINTFATFAFFTATLTAIMIFISIGNFVSIWVGDQFELGLIVIFFFCLNYYFFIARNPVHIIRDANGLYEDSKFIALGEGLVNFVISLLLVKTFGYAGILFGTSLSFVFEIILNYRLLRKKKIIPRESNLAFKYITNLLLYLLMIWINLVVVNSLGFYQSRSFITWTFECFIVGSANLIVLSGIYYIFYKDNFKELISIILRLLKRG